MADNRTTEPVPEPGEEITRRTCFVIARIGGDTSDERRKTDGLIDLVLGRVLGRIGFDVEVAHRVDRSGSITDDVIQRVVNSDLVVADVTGLNPNVVYELAVRHCKRRPVLVLADRSITPPSRLPFDIASDRAIFYDDDFSGAIVLEREIEKKALAALEDEEPDNPVVRAMKDERFDALVQSSEDSLAKAMASRMDRLESMIGSVFQRRGGRRNSSLAARQFTLSLSEDVYNAVLVRLSEVGTVLMSTRDLVPTPGDVHYKMTVDLEAPPEQLEMNALIELVDGIDGVFGLQSLGRLR